MDKVAGLDGLIRSHIQFQGEVASYVFAGSEPGLMKQLFETQGATAVRIGGSHAARRACGRDIAAYVAERFRQSKRSVGEALNPLLAAAKGHPQRAMLLAHRLWAEVTKGEDGGARRLGARPRGRAGRASARVRRAVARLRYLAAEDDARGAPGDGSPYRAPVLGGSI